MGEFAMRPSDGDWYANMDNRFQRVCEHGSCPANFCDRAGRFDASGAVVSRRDLSGLDAETRARIRASLVKVYGPGYETPLWDRLQSRRVAAELRRAQAVFGDGWDANGSPVEASP